MSMLSAQIDSLRTLADKLRNVNARQGDDFVESCETLFWSMGALREAADTIEILRDRLQESYEQVPEQGERGNGSKRESCGTRWHELFGTPERAARTLLQTSIECNGAVSYCDRCPFYGVMTCPGNLDEDDYDALLEWLRGDA